MQVVQGAPAGSEREAAFRQSVDVPSLDLSAVGSRLSRHLLVNDEDLDTRR